MNEAIAVFPDDILHEIFRHINGWTVTQCRAVCRRWRDAVDSLSNHDWEKICQNDAFCNEYVKTQRKSGLPWFDVFRVTASWSRINSADMKTTLLCEDTKFFKVLPGGAVACLQNAEDPDAAVKFCDTIVYFDSQGHQCEKQELDFKFDAALYDENEHLQVFLLKDKRLCVIVKETKKKYFVGSVRKWDDKKGGAEMTLIDKEVYFKNLKDNIIYCSRLTNKKTLETKCLEAFEENHENFDAETIITFAVKNGLLYFISDEGSSWRANIYVHEDADIGCATQIEFDDPYLLTEMAQYGFDWRSKPIFTYLCNMQQSKIFEKNAFHAHGFAMLMARDNTRIIQIHYVYLIYAIEHLLLLLKKKPKRTIALTDVLPNETKSVVQMDIVETMMSHKVLTLIGKKLYVFEFSHNSSDNSTTDTTNLSDNTTDSSKIPGNSTTNSTTNSSKLSPGNSTINSTKSNSKMLKVVKKKNVAKPKGVKTEKIALAAKHAYATRSRVTL